MKDNARLPQTSGSLFLLDPASPACSATLRLCGLVTLRRPGQRCVSRYLQALVFRCQAFPIGRWTLAGSLCPFASRARIHRLKTLTNGASRTLVGFSLALLFHCSACTANFPIARCGISVVNPILLTRRCSSLIGSAIAC